MQPTGIHHVSALSRDIRRNYAFYTQVMGMRLVKRTVNQDAPTTHHFFYADGVASPGSDLTFFGLPRAAPEHRGKRSITRTTLRVANEASLAYWHERFGEHGVPHGDVREIGGRPSLTFEDPDGLSAALVADDRQGDAHPWERSPVPTEHQVLGLGPVTLTVPELASTDGFLVGVLNLQRAHSYTDLQGTAVQVFEMGTRGAPAEVHVAVRPDLPDARYGAGGVHHVALRVPNEAEYHAWTARLQNSGLAFSGEIDRHYFRSLYVREPNGVLFELATDGPGFTTDEPLATLGERLALPPFLEGQRARIEAKLAPLDIPPA